jgi:hypothetical protein
MGKITWNNRSDTAAGETRQISASIFNDTKTSVNAVYDIIEAQLGTTSSTKDENLIVSGNILISGSIIPNVVSGQTTSSLNLGSENAAWNELFISTASINFVSPDGSITKFSKKDVTDLKAGKSLRTDAKQIANEVDDTTYVRMGVAGKAFHYASNKTLIKLQTSSFELGNAVVPVTIIGTTIAITGSSSTTGSNDISGSQTNTGSFDISGSTTNTGSYDISGSTTQTGSFGCSGSFAVNDLLGLLANYGQAGFPTGSGEGGVSVGDINLDGQVNVNDILLLLAGFGNPNILVQNLTLPVNTNHQFCGPVYSISQSIILTIPTSSVGSITC